MSAEKLLENSGSSQIQRPKRGSYLRNCASAFLHPMNRQTQHNVSLMLSLVRQPRNPSVRPVVLIVGGGSAGAGLQQLYEAEDIDILGFDIYWSPLTQFIADGHRIPLADESIDGVIVQSVLEHVLDPQAVVDQIHRVLKPDGLVYADTPFLQQVHEGPYDFTRFTDSGHRYLFKNFHCIESGGVAGAGTQLAWSIDYFFRAAARSRTVGLLARLAFFWLMHIDRFLDAKYSLDSASSVYFLGRKSNSGLTSKDIIRYYKGAQWSLVS